MEVRGPLIEDLEIAAVAQPCLERSVGDAERQWVRREHHFLIIPNPQLPLFLSGKNKNKKFVFWCQVVTKN